MVMSVLWIIFGIIYIIYKLATDQGGAIYGIMIVLGCILLAIPVVIGYTVGSVTAWAGSLGVVLSIIGASIGDDKPDSTWIKRFVACMFIALILTMPVLIIEAISGNWNGTVSLIFIIPLCAMLPFVKKIIAVLDDGETEKKNGSEKQGENAEGEEAKDGDEL